MLLILPALFLLLMSAGRIAYGRAAEDNSAHKDAQVINSDEPPVIPIGANTYLMWERWPYLRIGARAYMRSTYDRTGGSSRRLIPPSPSSSVQERYITGTTASIWSRASLSAFASMMRGYI